LRLAPLLIGFALVACGKAEAPPPPPAPPSVNVTPDPVIGKIDQFELHLSHVRDRLARLPATLNPEDAALQALIMAAEDLLAVREMYVLKEQPLPNERPLQSAERFAANVWRGEPTCAADPGDVPGSGGAGDNAPPGSHSTAGSP